MFLLCLFFSLHSLSASTPTPQSLLSSLQQVRIEQALLTVREDDLLSQLQMFFGDLVDVVLWRQFLTLDGDEAPFDPLKYLRTILKQYKHWSAVATKFDIRSESFDAKQFLSAICPSLPLPCSDTTYQNLLEHPSYKEALQTLSDFDRYKATTDSTSLRSTITAKFKHFFITNDYIQ
ncbi:hypothetical protein ScalyP_jg5101 [Parmales sp. scaly parma]|nr:hypothetical protein ScalyP_jg5101 [Parmales sp. scaly parma]